METQAYPGKGLSLSQLVFALNEELKHTAYSPSFTFDKVSQLDQDASTALATIREWRNSFIRINCIPLDVLSLIPTHLDSQKDRFRVTFVCRHWRRTFLQYATLWSQLGLSKGAFYVTTLLERAKGSALDVIVSRKDPIGSMTLLPPHNNQIRYLDFACNNWVDIQRFSEVNPGPFPLLRTLIVNAVEEINLDGTGLITFPSLPLFSNAVTLDKFHLHTEGSPFLSHFAFPNLTTFELFAVLGEEFHASELLSFLEASPMLQAVDVKIAANISFEGVPPERVVVLPNVEAFCLDVTDGGPGYRIAAHLSCPSAKCTSFVHEKDIDETTPQEIFPTLVSWNTIVRQYATSPAEEVTLEIKIDPNPVITCSLIFRSPDATVINLIFRVIASDEDEDEFDLPPMEMHNEVFSQASKFIQDHPQLANVKRLRICHSFLSIGSTEDAHIANGLGRLFKSLGPLEELTIYCCDLQPYLPPSFHTPEFSGIEEPVVFPPVKDLTITHPLFSSDEQCVAAIVGLAAWQHLLGVPFERVTIRMGRTPAAMAEGLRQWVGTVYCYDEMWLKNDH